MGGYVHTLWYTYKWATCAQSCATQGINVVLPFIRVSRAWPQ